MNLADTVDKAPLVGKRYRSLLKKLKIRTIEDLLHHYPSRYDDYAKIKKITQLFFEEPATIKVRIQRLQNVLTHTGKHLTAAVVSDETGYLEVVWFNQPFIVRNIKIGDLVNLSGKLAAFDNKPVLVNPEYELLDGRPCIHTGRIVPIYPETAGVSSKWLRAVISRVIKHPGFESLIDYLPKEIRKLYGFLDLKTAMQKIHFPESEPDITRAKERLAFDELFLLQLESLFRKRQWKDRGKAPAFKLQDWKAKLEDFVGSLPFELTKAQKVSVKELLDDLGKTEPMNRLLQGDVGSGKTVVATIGMYLAYLNGYQSICMAPTEVLAQQHYNTILELLKPHDIKISLHTGSQKTPKSKTPAIIIGTHALLYDTISFNSVGFVIIDEQHKFGVEQRAKLIKKARTELTPHLLTMTATPIPRSLALTAYGDLDLSTIDELPPGRKPVKTFLVPPQKREAAEKWIRKQIIQEAAQVFVICPLILESEKLQIKAATEEYKRLKTEVFPDFRVGLLHGQLPNKEKKTVLENFRSKTLDIVVATSVVEVGIDIPTATIMIIEGAGRFGLASLHQLRGRVGRGDKDSYCFLFTESQSKKGHKRLKYLETIHNGIKLAELDLGLRGPGELYGLKQHGLIGLKVASLSDTKLIQQSYMQAKEIIMKDSSLEKHPDLRGKIKTEGQVVPD